MHGVFEHLIHNQQSVVYKAAISAITYRFFGCKYPITVANITAVNRQNGYCCILVISRN